MQSVPAAAQAATRSPIYQGIAPILMHDNVLREHSKPTVKQRLAALRMLFDWMVVG